MTVKVSLGTIPLPIVLTTSPPPSQAPRKTVIAHYTSATRRLLITPEPYAIPIVAAAPLAPILNAKNNPIEIAMIVSTRLTSFT